MKAEKVVVDDRMQRGYTYYRSGSVGRNVPPQFRPQLMPKQMLALGVFDACPNCFGVNASQSLATSWRNEWTVRRIRVAGSNGTAATTWAVAPPPTRVRSGDGGRSRGTSPRLVSTASRVTSSAGAGSARLHWAYDSRAI